MLCWQGGKETSTVIQHLVPMMTNAVPLWQKVVLEHFPVVLNPSYELLNNQADLPLMFLSDSKVQYSVMPHIPGHYSGTIVGLAPFIITENADVLAPANNNQKS